MTDTLYQEIILEEFRHPQHVGALADADLIITETNASCGDEVTIYLKKQGAGDLAKKKEPVKNKKIIVIQVKWQGKGCAISQAAMSVLSTWLQGKTLTQIQALTQRDLEEMLGLEQGIAIGRVKCLMLGLVAVQKATLKTQT